MGEAAFVEAAERHRDELRVHCYRMLGSFSDAEDLVQETLLRAWRKRDGFEGRSTLRAWLYRIATNACLDFLASPARAREVAMAESPIAEITWLEPYPDRLLDAASEVVEKETIELAFLAAVQHLPPRQRAVLITRDVLGWPAAETAVTLDMSVASVKSALQRARATMRAKLPERRAEWSRRAGEREQAVVRRYVEASQGADPASFTALLREDARQTMPPVNLVYEGRAAILAMWESALADTDTWGEWRSVATSANRQPAVANWARPPGQSAWTPVNIDVLRIEDDRIAEITTFGPELLAEFGL